MCKKRNEEELKFDKDNLDYSTGEDESEFDIPFNFLDKSEQAERSHFLWHRAFVKARGGAKILEKFTEVHQDILKFGTTKNINFDMNQIERDAWK